LARLISNSSLRLYLDHNATSPPTQAVKEWVRGDFFLANPSSRHSSGQKALKFINQTKEFLLELYNLKNTHKVFFHSGATEGINTILKGIPKPGTPVCFHHSVLDHPCVSESIVDLVASGHSTREFGVSVQGQFLAADIDASIQDTAGQTAHVLNFTQVNNELGLVCEIDDIVAIKKRYPKAIVHVDCSQSSAKIANFTALSSQIDTYTFSGHKFGALKGVGFSFIRSDLALHPLIHGGGQQAGLRSGTQNVEGIYALKLALEDVQKNYDFIQNCAARNELEEQIKKCIAGRGQVIGPEFTKRNSNTTNFILFDHPAEIVLAAFDMGGVDVSNGSACSSGTSKSSPLLMALGLDEQMAKQAIRLSLGAYTGSEDVGEIVKKIVPILQQLLK